MKYQLVHSRLLFAQLCASCVFAAPTALAAGAGALRVGVCKRDITPVTPALAGDYEATFGVAAAVNHTDPVFLAGFGHDRRATGYHDRLWARGVVIESRGTRVALVSLDVLGYFKNEIDTIRAMVSPHSRIDHVVVASTHQHEGPDTLGLWGSTELSTGLDTGYLDFVNATVAACVDEAASTIERAVLFLASTDSQGLSLGVGSRDDGWGVADGKVLAGDALLAPETDGRIVDPTLTALQFVRRRWPKTVIATLVSFASHPESLGAGNTTITSDFPHFVRERLQREYGGVAIWISGALGVLQGPLWIDVEDPDTGLAAPRRTFRFAEVHGIQLAERAIEAIDAARFRTIELAGSVFRIRHFGDAKPELHVARIDPVPIQLDNPFFRLFMATGVLNPRRVLFTNGQPDTSIGFPYPPPFDTIAQALGSDVHTEVSVLQIGAAQMAVVPTELDPQIGMHYRAALEANGAEHTLIVGLGNDHLGYQVPFDKWNPSCFACAPYTLAGVPELCPAFPSDCSTVFENNVGQLVDPQVREALYDAIDLLP